MKFTDDVNLKEVCTSASPPLPQIAGDACSYVGLDVVSLCSEAAMQQTCEKMVIIDLDKDMIHAEVLDSLGVAMENFHFALCVSNPPAHGHLEQH